MSPIPAFHPHIVRPKGGKHALHVALCQQPAHGFLAQKEEFLLENVAYTLLRGPVLVPHLSILRYGNTGEPYTLSFSEEDIKKLHFYFHSSNKPPKLWEEHMSEKAQSRLLESYLLSQAWGDWPAGTWIQTWALPGKLGTDTSGGFSLQGWFDLQQAEVKRPRLLKLAAERSGQVLKQGLAAIREAMGWGTPSPEPHEDEMEEEMPEPLLWPPFLHEAEEADVTEDPSEPIVEPEVPIEEAVPEPEPDPLAELRQQVQDLEAQLQAYARQAAQVPIEHESLPTETSPLSRAQMVLTRLHKLAELDPERV